MKFLNKMTMGDCRIIMKKRNKRNRKKYILLGVGFLILTVAITATILVVLSYVRNPDEMHMQEEIYKVWTDANNFDANSFLAAFETEASFIVTEVEEIDNDCYTITCDVTSPDLLELLIQYNEGLTQSLTDHEINSALIEMISSAELKTTQQTVTAFKTDDGYIIEFTDGFIDAMYGYSYNYCCEQLENLVNSFNQ